MLSVGAGQSSLDLMGSGEVQLLLCSPTCLPWILPWEPVTPWLILMQWLCCVDIHGCVGAMQWELLVKG